MRPKAVNLRLVLILTAAATLAACGSGSDQLGAKTQKTVPEEFRAACGKPGSIVEVRTERVTVRREDCDLRGVTLTHRGAGAVVPGAAGEQVQIFQDAPAGQRTQSAAVSVDREDESVTFIYTSVNG